MATYYVRKSGSDSNGGTDPDTDAWLTIDKAANTVAAADNVYVGAGVYRELVTLDTSGSSGSQITWIADVDGANTGDAGLVIVSAYADEESTASRAACFATQDRIFNTIRGFTLVGGTDACIDAGTTASAVNTGEGVIIEDCAIFPGHTDNEHGIWYDFGTSAEPTAAGLIVRRCVFSGSGVYLVASSSGPAADVDQKAVIENSLFVGNGEASDQWAAISMDLIGGAFFRGGVDITNCTIYGYAIGINADQELSTADVSNIRNCTFLYTLLAIELEGTNDGALTSDYNYFGNCAAPLTGVTAGANDQQNTFDPGLFGGLGDYTLYRFLGWSPFLPFEPIRLQDDAYKHAFIGNANTGDAPADDLYGSPRPMYGTVDDIGAVESRARPEKETTTVRTGSNASRFEGAGWHDFLIPVSAASTTISIYGRFDSNYTGSKPKLDVFNIPGVADQTDIMTGSANAWEEITATFTPDAAGVCRLRVSSQDTSATGESFFDDLTVT